LESRFLSARDALVLQSVRLAIDVLFRSLVWRRRRRQAEGRNPGPAGAVGCGSLDGVCAPDRHDLAQPVPGIADSEMDDQGDLSDRQDRTRHAALHALPRAGVAGGPVFSAQGGNTRLQMAASADSVRSAFAADFLLRRIPVLWRALDPGPILAWLFHAAVGQLRRHACYDWARMAA